MKDYSLIRDRWYLCNQRGRVMVLLTNTDGKAKCFLNQSQAERHARELVAAGRAIEGYWQPVFIRDHRDVMSATGEIWGAV